jgi:hypothetical protein
VGKAMRMRSLYGYLNAKNLKSHIGVQMKFHIVVVSMLFSICLFPMGDAYGGNIFGEFFRGVKAQFKGDNEITNLGDGTIEVTYYAAISESRSDKHTHWQNLAKKACGGSGYTVISKRYQEQATVDQIIIGIIKCSDNKVIEGHSPQNIATNKKVRKAQTKLASLGYDIDIDGIFGKQTQNAIKDFQSKNNLPITGNLDDKTIDKLDQSADYTTISPPRENAKNSTLGRKAPEKNEFDGEKSETDDGIDTLNRLDKLYQLKQGGIITDDEFNTLKERLINQLYETQETP